jgi:threonine synthase
VQPGERAVLLLTGHTLKDPEYTIDFHKDLLATDVAEADEYRRPPLVLDADESSVMRALEKEMAGSL